MPELTLSFDLRHVDVQFLSAIHQKSQLCTHAEKRDSQEWDLFQNTPTTKFLIDQLLTVEIMNSQRRDLHYVAYVQKM